MALVMQLDNPRQQFDDSWWSWQEAIIKYAAATLNKPKQLAAILKDKDSDQGILLCFYAMWYYCYFHTLVFPCIDRSPNVYCSKMPCIFPDNKEQKEGGNLRESCDPLHHGGSSSEYFYMEYM